MVRDGLNRTGLVCFIKPDVSQKPCFFGLKTNSFGITYIRPEYKTGYPIFEELFLTGGSV